jgi:hypothetical protein
MQMKLLAAVFGLFAVVASAQTTNTPAVKIGQCGATGFSACSVRLDSTNFISSTLNSTTAQLGAGARFTGTIETVYYQQAISLLFTTDQPGMLTVHQCIDAVCAFETPYPAKAYAVSTTSGVQVGYSVALPANGNFFYLDFLNTGSIATTKLNINTAYGTLPSMTQLGNGPVAINEVGGAVVTSSGVPVASSSSITNPTSTLILTSATTAYTAGQFIASSATAGSVVVPSFAIANTAGGATIPRVRLSINDTTSTAWPAVSINVDLWSNAPTFTNGDRGTWLPATGAAVHLGTFNCTMSAVWGDGVSAECAPAVGTTVTLALASGTAVYWTLEAITASGVTGVSKVARLKAEVWN